MSLKFFVYFVLFIAFLKIYLVKQTTEFLEGRTTFSSSYEKSHDTEFPSILICFSPPFKNKKGKSLILTLPDNDYGSYKEDNEIFGVDDDEYEGTLFENYSKCRIWLFLILAFSTKFFPIKSDLSGNTVWLQPSDFHKLVKLDKFWHL